MGLLLSVTAARSAFSQETERAVAEAGCPFAFAFEARDIETPLAEARALMRCLVTTAMPSRMARSRMERRSLSRAC